MTIVATGIRVNFGGVQALGGVDLEVRRGEIVGLLGPNGAGKTTMFNCITGVVAPSAGQVSIDGNDVSRERVDERVRRGISRTFQTPRLDLNASVADAVMLGFTPQVKQSWAAQFLGTRGVRAQEQDLRRRAVDLIRQLRITDDPDQRAGDLSLGTLRLVEVARAVAADPNYLLLDEPAAGTDEGDRERLATAIRGAAERGLGVLLVEHNVPFVSSLSHRLVAMVNGKVVAQGAPADVLADPQVTQAYIGEKHVH
jgi:ABC-type branched-subunit amino acid transport system ATPase component